MTHQHRRISDVQPHEHVRAEDTPAAIQSLRDAAMRLTRGRGSLRARAAEMAADLLRSVDRPPEPST